MAYAFHDRYPPPWHVDELPSGYRVVSSNGCTLAWIYSAEGITRSADSEKLTHAEALAMAKAITMLVTVDSRNRSYEDRSDDGIISE
jgi:hypothetical protein